MLKTKEKRAADLDRVIENIKPLLDIDYDIVEKLEEEKARLDEEIAEEKSYEMVVSYRHGPRRKSEKIKLK